MTWSMKLVREPVTEEEKALLNLCLTKRTSYIAFKWARYDRPLEVCRSNGKFYIGALNEEGLPLSRDSAHYYQTQEEAQQALDTRTWTQMLEPGT